KAMPRRWLVLTRPTTLPAFASHRAGWKPAPRVSSLRHQVLPHRHFAHLTAVGFIDAEANLHTAERGRVRRSRFALAHVVGAVQFEVFVGAVTVQVISSIVVETIGAFVDQRGRLAVDQVIGVSYSTVVNAIGFVVITPCAPRAKYGCFVVQVNSTGVVKESRRKVVHLSGENAAMKGMTRVGGKRKDRSLISVMAIQIAKVDVGARAHGSSIASGSDGPACIPWADQRGVYGGDLLQASTLQIARHQRAATGGDGINRGVRVEHLHI